MDASSAAACCSSSSNIGPGEATLIITTTTQPHPLSPVISSSLPPSQYLQTCPHLLTNTTTSSPNHNCNGHPLNYNDACNNIVNQQEALTTGCCYSSNSLNFDSRSDGYNRRQSIKSETSKVPQSGAAGSAVTEVDLANSNRSTSSPQLVTVKSRSKVYRRASLKSLTNLPLLSPSQSRVIKVSGRNNKNNEKWLIAGSKAKGCAADGEDDEDKENAVVCNPLSYPFPYSTSCQKSNKDGDESTTPGQQHCQDEVKQQPKSKSCSSFLPILSLIPHTVISFQYPSPKIKFSWWRNKIS